MTILLGIDPGRTTGWGIVKVSENHKLSIVEFGVTHDLTALELSGQIQGCDLMIVESFLVRPREARKGAFDYDPMETPQVIGALKVLAQIHGKRVVEQSPSVKPVGYGFVRQKYVKGKKGMHMWDALAHAAFYAVKHLNAKPLGL